MEEKIIFIATNEGDYLGTLNGKVLAGFQVEEADISEELRRQHFADYAVAKKLGRLALITLGDNCSVQTRDLTDDEKFVFDNVNHTMQRAEKIAMSRLVVKTFQEELGKI